MRSQRQKTASRYPKIRVIRSLPSQGTEKRFALSEIPVIRIRVKRVKFVEIKSVVGRGQKKKIGLSEIRVKRVRVRWVALYMQS